MKAKTTRQMHECENIMKNMNRRREKKKPQSTHLESSSPAKIREKTPQFFPSPFLIFSPSSSSFTPSDPRNPPATPLFFSSISFSPADSYLLGQAITCFPVHLSAGMGSSNSSMASATSLSLLPSGGPPFV